jgi:hypothetical protein
MREIRQSGSVEGAAGDRGPYSDHSPPTIRSPSFELTSVNRPVSPRVAAVNVY